jgi:hypothetical protein
VLEPSYFLCVTWHGAFLGWGFRVSEFVSSFFFFFSHVWLQQESVLFESILLKVSLAHRAGSQWVGGLAVGRQSGRPVDL